MSLPGFANRFRIPIDHTKINSTLSNYPIKLVLSPSSGINKANLTALVTLLGYAGRKKIAVTTADGVTQCYVEIALWVDSPPLVILYVNIPSISNASDTTLYLYYDYTHVDNTAFVGDTLDATTPNVWPGYASVWHLQGNAYDSASLRNHGVVGSGVTWIAGIIGLAAQFNGSNQITVADNALYSPSNNAGRLCVQHWFKTLTLTAMGTSWLTQAGKINPCEWKWDVYGSGGDGSRRFYVHSADCGWGSGATSSNNFPPLQLNTWYHEHGQVFSGMVSLYEGPGSPARGTRGTGGDIDVNQGWNRYGLGEGVPNQHPITLTDTSSPVMIGRSNGQSGFACLMSEFRISYVNRNIAWMKADDYSELDNLVSYISESVTQYTLTIQVPTGSGSTNPTTGAWLYNSGTQVSITATPAAGYAFDHWLLDGVSQSANPLTITMSANHTLQAVFTAVTTQYMLTIQAPTGSGSTNPATGAWLYNSGAQAQVTATPAAGYTLDHWLLDGASQTANPISVTMSANHILQAVFVATSGNPTLTIQAASGNGVTNPGAGTTTYTPGTIVPITATPGTYTKLDHWVIDGANYTATVPLNIQMNANHTVQAVFAADTTTIVVELVDGVGGTIDSASPYLSAGIHEVPISTTQQIHAIPSAGFTFSKWNYWINGVLTTNTFINPYSFQSGSPGRHFTFQPVFTGGPTQFTLTVQAPTGSGTTTPATGSYPYNSGAQAQATATPGTGYYFDHWIVDGANQSANPLTLTMSANHTIQAVFTQSTFKLTYLSTPGILNVTMNGTLVQNGGFLTFPVGTTVVVKPA